MKYIYLLRCSRSKQRKNYTTVGVCPTLKDARELGREIISKSKGIRKNPDNWKITRVPVGLNAILPVGAYIYFPVITKGRDY